MLKKIVALVFIFFWAMVILVVMVGFFGPVV
jgi:hypothetical protein